MKLAMVISQTSPELVFNAFRLANFSQLRNSQGSELCPLSTMKDLYTLIREADRVVTF
jgi:hypothetical protein